MPVMKPTDSMRVRVCRYAGCERAAIKGHGYCQGHAVSPEAVAFWRELKAATTYFQLGQQSIPSDITIKREFYHRFQRKVERGEFNHLLDGSMTKIIIEAAQAQTRTLELGAMRVAIMRLLAEEIDPTRMAFGIARLSNAITRLLTAPQTDTSHLRPASGSFYPDTASEPFPTQPPQPAPRPSAHPMANAENDPAANKSEARGEGSTATDACARSPRFGRQRGEERECFRPPLSYSQWDQERKRCRSPRSDVSTGTVPHKGTEDHLPSPAGRGAGGEGGTAPLPEVTLQSEDGAAIGTEADSDQPLSLDAIYAPADPDDPDAQPITWRDQLDRLARQYALAERYPEFQSGDHTPSPTTDAHATSMFPTDIHRLDDYLPYILENQVITPLDDHPDAWLHPLLDPVAPADPPTNGDPQSNEYALYHLFEQAKPPPVH